VKVAKDTGDGRFLWPSGIDTIEEVPDELLRAIEHATTVLVWYENLPKEDMPPEWMWHLPKQLDLHFKMVDEKRSGGSSDSDDEPNVVARNKLLDDDRWSRE
jgi:hypothetical protein